MNSNIKDINDNANQNNNLIQSEEQNHISHHEIHNIDENLQINHINDINNNIINNNLNNSNYQPQITNPISINNEESIDINGLTKEEIIKAKENSFILLGKTGVGKTSLLNVIYGKDIGKVGYSTLSETKTSKYYCIKEKIDNKIEYFTIIDTPGLYDTSGKESDEVQKKKIMELISNENLKIKGLLFLSNFQNERFDASEQSTLIEYNKIFPLKDFWKRVIFIFTHYFGDPNSYTKEEIKENNNIYKAEIFKLLMLKVKNVSTPVQFKDLNCKYVNVFTRNLNEKKAKSNLETRKELISEILKYIKLKPMFSKLQIFNFKNYEMEKNDNFLYDCDLYIYLDTNDKIIHQEFQILKRIPKNNSDIIPKEQKVHLNIEDCKMDEEGNLIKITTKKEGIEEIFKNYKGEIGGGITILSLIGSVISGFIFPPILFVSVPSMFGGAFLWNKNRIEKEEERIKAERIMMNQKIMELVKNEIDKFNK